MAIDLNAYPDQLPPGGFDWPKIQRQLLLSAETWVPRIFPNGRRGENGYWRVADITGRAPRDKGSLAFDLHATEPDKLGYEHDPIRRRAYDPIGTIRDHFHLEGRALYERCLEIAGPGASAAPNSVQLGPRPASPTEKAEATAREVAHVINHSSDPIGTLAETYFRSRGLECPAGPDVLYHPNLSPWHGATEGYPAIVARAKTPDGSYTGGIHRTFLKADGSHHIGGDKAKMMLGPIMGGVIQYQPVAADGVLLVGEGPESALAAQRLYQQKTGAMVPAWSCMTAGGMGSRDRTGNLKGLAGWVAANHKPNSPNNLIKRLVIAVDGDDAGRSAGEALCEAAGRVGLAVEVYHPSAEGRDFCDDLVAGLELPEPIPIAPPAQGALALTQPEAEATPSLSRPGLPSIKTGGGQLSANIDDAEKYLIEAQQPIYQYGDRLVRVARGAIIAAIDHEKVEIMGSRTIEMTNMAMRDDLTRHINFTTWDSRTKKDRPINVPADIAEGILHRVGKWNFPVLTGIVSAPIIRPDLTLIDKIGYDADTGLYLAPGEAVCPQILSHPTREQGIAAAEYLLEPLREVKFTNGESRSVVLSGILSGLDRAMLDFVPIHAIDAPQAGSGKGLLCNYIAIIATGHEAPAVGASADPLETDKAIGAKLIQGHNIILLDNVMHPLDSALLAQMMTQGVLDIRVLGLSKIVTVPNAALVLANGNNIGLLGDLPRRSLKARLDAQEERPELRTFTSEHPLAVARRDRANLVAAALTVMLAFRRAGSPAPQGVTELGSFEKWSRNIRNAIIWLGLPDPVKTQEAIRSVNRKSNAHLVLMTEWLAAFPPSGQNGTTSATPAMASRKLIEAASQRYGGDVLGSYTYPDLRDALLTVAADKIGRNVDAARLGNFLAGHIDVVVGGMRIEKHDSIGHGGVALWRIARLAEAVELEAVAISAPASGQPALYAVEGTGPILPSREPQNRSAAPPERSAAPLQNRWPV